MNTNAARENATVKLISSILTVISLMTGVITALTLTMMEYVMRMTIAPQFQMHIRGMLIMMVGEIYVTVMLTETAIFLQKTAMISMQILTQARRKSDTMAKMMTAILIHRIHTMYFQGRASLLMSLSWMRRTWFPDRTWL